MSGRDILFVAIAGVLIFVAVKMFRPDPETAEDQEENDANRFREVWELWDPSPSLTASRKGLVTPSQMQEAAKNAEQIGLAIHALSSAPANWAMWDDDERAAVGAVMRGTYPEQLLFGDLFKVTKGTTVGAFLRSFMSPSSDPEWLGAIVHHIEKLRADHVTR